MLSIINIMYCINLLKLNIQEFGQSQTTCGLTTVSELGNCRPIAATESKAFLDVHNGIMSMAAIGTSGRIKYPINELYVKRNETVGEFINGQSKSILVFDKQTAEMMIFISPDLAKDFQPCELQPFIRKTIPIDTSTYTLRANLAKIQETKRNNNAH